MSLYTEELLTSRLNVEMLDLLDKKTFLPMLYKLFENPHYLMANGLMASKLIVSSPKIDWQGLCVDVVKLYDRTATSNKTRRIAEMLISIARIEDNEYSIYMSGNPPPSKMELRSQFVVNTMYHMGFLVSALSVERSKTLDELDVPIEPSVEM